VQKKQNEQKAFLTDKCQKKQKAFQIVAQLKNIIAKLAKQSAFFAYKNKKQLSEMRFLSVY
jgi:hypothetical protein